MLALRSSELSEGAKEWTQWELNPYLRNANAVYYRYTIGPKGPIYLKIA